MKRMHTVLSAVVLFAGCSSVAPSYSDGTGASAKSIHWTYEGDEGPRYWGTLGPAFAACSNGTSQSPINITHFASAHLASIDFHYLPGALKILNNGHSVQVNYPPGSFITISGIRYDLLQFHVHSPSEHKVNGAAFPAEIHLVHKSHSGRIAVVAVLVKTVPTGDNPAYAPVFGHLPATITLETPVTGVTVDAEQMLPKHRAGFRYTGSLTTPPCTEDVVWSVLKTPVVVSASQLSAFTAVFPHGNARPVQPLDGRRVLVDGG